MTRRKRIENPGSEKEETRLTDGKDWERKKVSKYYHTPPAAMRWFTAKDVFVPEAWRQGPTAFPPQSRTRNGELYTKGSMVVSSNMAPAARMSFKALSA